MSNGEEQRAAEADLPPWGRVLIRIMFREGPMVILAFAMAAVVLGIIPSPYLGDKLEALRNAHEKQNQLSQDMLDEMKGLRSDLGSWRREGYRRSESRLDRR